MKNQIYAIQTQTSTVTVGQKYNIFNSLLKQNNKLRIRIQIQIQFGIEEIQLINKKICILKV